MFRRITDVAKLIRLSACLQAVLTDESIEDDIWPNKSSKHWIYTYPFQEAKSSELDNSSSNINSASDDSSLV